MEITNTHVDAVIWDYIDRYARQNRAAATIRAALDEVGVGLRPVLDHISIRTRDVLERALEFEALGFGYDDHLGVIERDTWWAKVYRKPGFPAIYLDQPFADQRGNESPLRRWVDKFADDQLHHMAISVDRIEHAIERFSALGIEFTGQILGEPASEYRQIYTVAEMVDGEPFTTLELIERRWGFTGFLSPAANHTEV